MEKTAEKQVLVLTEELSGVKTTQAQEIRVHGIEVEALKVLLIPAKGEGGRCLTWEKRDHSALVTIAKRSTTVPGGGVSDARRDLGFGYCASSRSQIRDVPVWRQQRPDV